MSKRRPTSDLNHDNWDQEDDVKESAGEFKQATTDELKNRKILSAKRKSQAGSGDGAPKTPFGSFKGFGPASTSTADKPNFNFVVGTSSTPTATTNGEAKSKISSSEYFHQLKSLNVSVSAWIAKHVQSNPHCILTPVFRDYEKHLAKLESNRPQAVINENTTKPENGKEETEAETVTEVKPIAEVSDTEEKKSGDEKDETSPSSASSGSEESKKDTPEKEEKTETVEEEKPEEEKTSTETAAPAATGGIFGSFGAASTFSFGSAKPATTTASSSSFLFGNTNSTATSLFGNTTTSAFSSAANTQFSFGTLAANKPGTAPSTGLFGNTGNTGFSFGAFASKPAENTEGGNEEEAEESEEPPKVEFKAVAEEHSVYEKKCKMFVKKDGEYKERGLGQLYIKQKDADSKAQLLVRSASATGQILLNVLLNSSITPTRLGKNNVQMACMALPGDAAPSIVMIRVKAGEDADELLAKIEEYKK